MHRGAAVILEAHVAGRELGKLAPAESARPAHSEQRAVTQAACGARCGCHHPLEVLGQHRNRVPLGGPGGATDAALDLTDDGVPIGSWRPRVVMGAPHRKPGALDGTGFEPPCGERGEVCSEHAGVGRQRLVATCLAPPYEALPVSTVVADRVGRVRLGRELRLQGIGVPPCTILEPDMGFSSPVRGRPPAECPVSPELRSST